MKAITPSVIATVRRALVDFGYTSLTYNYVKQTVDQIVAGQDPKDVIGLFVRDMLNKNGYLLESTAPPDEAKRP